jgi:glycosyltransferase involved in cell wall biosynthesis
MSPDPRPLSIGVLVGSLSREAGGLFNSVRRSAISLKAAGCAVTVYGLADAYTDQDIDQWRPLEPQVFRAVGPRRLGYAPDLAAALARGNHDVVHLHGLWQLLSAQATAWRRATGRPVMLSPRGMLDDWALKNAGLKKKVAAHLFERANLEGAACLHALNESEAAAMRAFGLTNPIAVIPNGADLPARLMRAAPGWMSADRRRTLLFLGRIHPKKGIRELLLAWARLKLRAPAVAASWRLALAGWDDGGHMAELQRLATELDLQGDVIFPGPLFGDAKAGALANAGAFVLPSFSEGLPMAVLEAWAYGRPVLMTEACNLPEGFTAEAAVRISTEPEALARELEMALNGPDLMGMGARGRALVRERFTWGAIAQAHAEVYGWMRDGGPAPPCVVMSDAAATGLRQAG